MSAITPEQSKAVRALVSALRDLSSTELVRAVRAARAALPRKRPKPRGPSLFPSVDLKGRRVGTLTVTRWLGRSRWECKCDCGEVRVVSTGNVVLFGVKGCRTCSVKGARTRILARFDEILARYYGDFASLDACASMADTTGSTLMHVFRLYHLPIRRAGGLSKASR